MRSTRRSRRAWPAPSTGGRDSIRSDRASADASWSACATTRGSRATWARSSTRRYSEAMSPTVHLAAATTAFLVTHFVPSTPLRPKLVAAMGEWPYRGAYSLVAFATLGWMIWAYNAAPQEALWPGLRLAPLLVTPFAFVLLA